MIKIVNEEKRSRISHVRSILPEVQQEPEIVPPPPPEAEVLKEFYENQK